MIAGAPRATAANGTRSRARNVAASASIDGNVTWESSGVAPWPGKCL